MGIGLDMLEIERMERALERRPGLAKRLFLPGELAYASGRGRPGEHLAARFCAKEAVTKALGLEVFSPLDVEVVRGAGEVGLTLHGAARERAVAMGVEVEISMTHTRSMAAAVAIAR
jgi:holo-[acyl-carrier protein] synthase